jgi:hypothetical protein
MTPCTRYLRVLVKKLKTISSLDSDVPNDTQLVKGTISLDFQSLLIRKMQKTYKTETSTYIR